MLIKVVVIRIIMNIITATPLLSKVYGKTKKREKKKKEQYENHSIEREDAYH